MMCEHTAPLRTEFFVLRYRLASAIVLIPLVLGSVYIGGPVYFAFVSVLLLLAGLEFLQMARRAGYQPLFITGLSVIALMVLQASARVGGLREIFAAAVIVSFIAAIFKRSEGWIVGWALTFAGALYIGGLGVYFILLRDLPDGMRWALFVLFATWAMDTSAYIFGTRMGRHGFFQNISPKKTWEGAVGGWAAATLVMLAAGALADLPPIHSLTLGLGISIAGTFGDLAESLLKRQFGVKDSGFIVPGHGGILDRIDSFLFAAAFTYYYLTLILRVQVS